MDGPGCALRLSACVATLWGYSALAGSDRGAVACGGAGQTASLVSKYRPPMPILTLVIPQLKNDGMRFQLVGRGVARQCQIQRGLLPVLAAPSPSGESLFPPLQYLAEGDCICVCLGFKGLAMHSVFLNVPNLAAHCDEVSGVGAIPDLGHLL